MHVLFLVSYIECVLLCLKVGLAVGDTAEERDKAMFTRTRLQVEFILELEATSSFLRGLMRPSDNRRQYWKKVCVCVRESKYVHIVCERANMCAVCKNCVFH